MAVLDFTESGSGPPLVLIHGLMMSGRMFSTVLPGFAEKHRVICPDLRGHTPRVRRLVLACTYAYNRGTLREKVEAAVAPWLIRGLGMPRFSRFMFSRALEIDDERAASLAQIMGSNDRKLMLKALHEGTFFDARPILSTIEAPTLIIAGGKDDAVPMHHAKQLVSGINGHGSTSSPMVSTP